MVIQPFNNNREGNCSRPSIVSTHEILSTKHTEGDILVRTLVGKAQITLFLAEKSKF
jgi:hypothetical protein